MGGNILELSSLFEIQLQRLKDRRCPKKILRTLRKMRVAVLKSAYQMPCSVEHIPFIPVIPITSNSPQDLIEMVQIGNEIGKTKISLADIIERGNIERSPYFILDVDDGRTLKGREYSEIAAIFKQKKRQGLNASELIALGTHSSIPAEYNAWALQALYRFSDSFVVLWKKDNNPRLGWRHRDFSFENFGWPSYGSRVTLANI